MLKSFEIKKAFRYYIKQINSMLLCVWFNHDERDDDDDVKFARRNWDESVAFGGKMKLKQWPCSRTTTIKNFVQTRSVSSVDIAYLSQSWPDVYWWRGVRYSGDIWAKIQAFRFLAKLTQNLTLIRTPSQSVSPNYRIHDMVYANILINYSRILRSSWISACC